MKRFLALLAGLIATPIYAGDPPVAVQSGAVIQERVTVTERVIPFQVQQFAQPAIGYRADQGCACNTQAFASSAVFATRTFAASSYVDPGIGAYGCQQFAPAFRSSAFGSYGVGGCGGFSNQAFFNRGIGYNSFGPRFGGHGVGFHGIGGVGGIGGVRVNVGGFGLFGRRF